METIRSLFHKINLKVLLNIRVWWPDPNTGIDYNQRLRSMHVIL